MFALGSIYHGLIPSFKPLMKSDGMCSIVIKEELVLDFVLPKVVCFFF
jgi:hypothetical protein